MRREFKAAARRLALVVCALLCAASYAQAQTSRRVSGFAEVNGGRMLLNLLLKFTL